MKPKRKEELQSDELADGLMRLFQRLRPYMRHVLIVAAAVAAILLWQWAGYRNRTTAGEQVAMEFFRAAETPGVSAMEDFIERNPKARQRPLAMLMAANRLLRAAVAGFDEGDKGPTAKEQLAKAEKLYRLLAKGGPPHAGLAKYGLALVSAQRGDMASAKQQLDVLMKEYRGKLVGEAAVSEKSRLTGIEKVEFAPEEKTEPKNKNVEPKVQDDKPAAAQEKEKADAQ
jgi:hypothetical protein